MARIVWSSLGSRRYETGLDRGVLYLTNGSGVPWSGLTSVQDEPSSETASPSYFDGKKYFDFPGNSDFSGTINAITYPNEFLQFDGYALVNNGMYFANQIRNTFSLSYRTFVATDSNENYGYKIHIIYDLTADPSSTISETLSDSVSIKEFSWKVYSRPSSYSGYSPVSHVVIDSTIMTANALTAIENKLYGTVSTSATLPTLTELYTLSTTV